MDPEDRIARRVKLHELRALLAAAELGSLAKAANRLALTQPAVSKTVAELEAKLGVRLLDRTARGVVPTAEGKLLLGRAVNIFGELRHIGEELDFLADPAAGELRVVCTPVLAAGLLPRIISQLVRERPGLRYNVLEAEPEAQVRALRARVTDILVGRDRPGNDDLIFERLFDEKLFIVAGVNHPLARRRKVSVEDLKGQRWIAPTPDTAVGQLLEPALVKLGLAGADAVVTTMSVVLRFSLLATGKFLTTLPGSLLFFGDFRRTLEVLPIELPQTAGRVGLATIRGVSLPPVARLFAQGAREVAKGLHGLNAVSLAESHRRR